MGSEVSVTFDLSALLHIDGLDIRKIANDNPGMHTGEYFALLVKFLDNVPHIKEQLIKSPDLNDAQGIKTLLQLIGCDKNNITNTIDGLQSKIHAARINEKPEPLDGVLNTEEKNYEKFESQLLDKAIKLIDHEEATRKLRILAVDDAPSVIKIITSVLNDEFKVYGMTNPTMMEKFLQQITPELFLLDYKMPELSGFDLIPIIRSFEKHKDTPIIFLTSMATSDYVTKAFALGACDYIVKPFQGKQLREKIHKHIRKKTP